MEYKHKDVKTQFTQLDYIKRPPIELATLVDSEMIALNRLRSFHENLEETLTSKPYSDWTRFDICRCAYGSLHAPSSSFRKKYKDLLIQVEEHLEEIDQCSD